MRHRKKKKLKIGYDRSRRVLKSMTTALILHEKIDTTSARAKLVRSLVERLITKGKHDNLHAKRQLFSALPPNAARKVFEVLAPKYKARPGGYTRLVRLGAAKDGSIRARIEFV
ncbi:MAG TPA: 50S ribosomal protein L17 [Candidatus Hodarchaeales archaeon]|uniref:50S ribosomal protein L17 n=1 Tax=Candidatus Doudnabacteria bacterium RIFCSPHIGHO2_01_FULL_50_11 TaxID=1817828 RepID=A0A1F5PET7_9BACT|nr:MAG: 50S ribosomal protein L17 [Candidatus Doudnabacteria bacterium RIFCSPHIGHO2_01_FULL_50_11]HKZ41452.1 50S ribosomal protein L17 [Candidatus Hodarchaeales archaeon]